MTDRLQTFCDMMGFTDAEAATLMRQAKKKFPGETEYMLETRVIHMLREQKDALMIERARQGISGMDDGA